MEKELKLARLVCQQAKKAGASEVGIQISQENEIHVALRVGQIDKLQRSQRQTMNLSVYCDGKFSQNTTNDLNNDSLEGFIKNVVELTKYLPSDECRRLPEAKYYPQTIDAVPLELCDPNHAKLTTEDYVSVAKTIDAAIQKESDKLVSRAISISGTSRRSLLFHSTEFNAAVEGTCFTVVASASFKDGERSRPEHYWWGSTRFLDELPAAGWLAKVVVQGVLAKIGQAKISSGKYDMLVGNNVAQEFVSKFVNAMGANLIQQKRSYLGGKIGKKIASEKLTVIDDPTIARGVGSRPVDREGIESKRRVMVENGILREYFVDSYYARKLKIDPTSGTISNLVVSSGSKTKNELVGQIKRGILVTDFIGGNSNPTTGDFSIGILGQLIENGQITKPVSSMNIAGNMNELWQRLVETGNDPFLYSDYRTPSLLFEDVDFSGI